MGILIGDVVQTPQGMGLANLYASFGGSFTLIKKKDGTYVAKAIFSYFYNRIRKPLFTEEYSLNVTEPQLNSNIMGLLYTAISKRYSKYEVV